MSLRYRVISIGALGRNRFWNETQGKRLSHATTTLIQDGDTTILVDPGLPAELLIQRLEERSGLAPDQIDVVFLTTFRPVHRRSLTSFSGATWLMHEPEILAMRAHLGELADRTADDKEDPDIERLIKDEQSLLARVAAADDKLTRQVHLFPAPGVSPGSAALLLVTATRTVVVAGDAVISRDYFDAGRVFEQATAVDQAQQSFSEIVEIADEIVPGHDNLFSVIAR